MSMYIGEAVSSALEEIYQAFMINSKLMEQGSVKIMYRYLILGDAVGKIISLPKLQTWLKTTTCQKFGKTTGMMITPIGFHHFDILTVSKKNERTRIIGNFIDYEGV